MVVSSPTRGTDFWRTKSRKEAELMIVFPGKRYFALSNFSLINLEGG